VPFFGGVFYDVPEPEAISEAIARLESMEALLHPPDLQAWARQFSTMEFKRRMSALLKLPAGISTRQLTVAARDNRAG